MHLKHPQTTPLSPSLWKKMSSTKLVPGAKTVGDGWSRSCESGDLCDVIYHASSIENMF